MRKPTNAESVRIKVKAYYPGLPKKGSQE